MKHMRLYIIKKQFLSLFLSTLKQLWKLCKGFIENMSCDSLFFP